MDKRYRFMFLFLASVLVGLTLAVAVFHASPQTHQRLRELPWYAGPLAGLVGGLALAAIGVPIVRRRRRKGAP